MSAPSIGLNYVTQTYEASGDLSKTPPGTLLSRVANTIRLEVAAQAATRAVAAMSAPPLGKAAGASFSAIPLSNGGRVLMIASKAIAAGQQVSRAANGRVTDSVTSGNQILGFAINPAAAAGDELVVEITDAAALANP